MRYRSKRDYIPKRPELDRLVFEILHDLAGISTRELARRSWLSESTIAKIRRGPSHGGTRYPRGTTTQELARLAGGAMRYIPRVNDEQESEMNSDQKLIPFIPRKRRA